LPLPSYQNKNHCKKQKKNKNKPLVVIYYLTLTPFFLPLFTVLAIEKIIGCFVLGLGLYSIVIGNDWGAQRCASEDTGITWICKSEIALVIIK
jgi:hypothetical protein